ncbi:MAG: hypothetical protein K9H16_13800, partial [Bacteroidales bacterium]|nr:hypothetical protein [Bacteroidales bacterium]
WEGENTASLIYSQTLETITENSWNTVNLTNPLQIDASEELYIGLLIFGQPNGVTTIGYDSGPAVDGKGDFISFDGSNWNELQNLGFDFNWNIQAYVNFNVGNKTISLDDEIFEPLFNSINTTLKLKPNMQNFLVKVPDNRGLLGYNIYRDGQKLNENLLAETFYTDLDLPAGSYEYYVTSVYFAGESEPCGSVYATVTLLSHDFQLKAGWNSVSSNIVPMNPAVEFICNPIMEQFLFMKDMNNFYSPAYNHNGIENWDLTTGYLIKVGQDCQLPFQGFPNEAHTITLNNGWNLMPVLSDCEINTEDFFSDIQAYIRIVKDAAGTGVYWPSANINSLPVLEPGKAYYVKIFSTQSVTFPLCD